MPRVKRGPKRRASRAKTLQLASGYFLTKSKLYRSAQEAVERALKFAYVGRKRKKRDFRSLWIVRISAAAREAGLTYSKFMHGLKLSGIELDRKVLAETASADPSQFALIVAQVKTALAGAGQQ
ncbi:MAG TPA: 50S ribosomal protein L20 [Bryobacteraceae bacterium]|nr:50S ribosomal protein L20 [Bryobacteraceae bacterium]